MNEVKLSLSFPAASSPLLPVGIPLDMPGGKVLIEGDNLRAVLHPDAETGQLAFTCAVVFRVPKASDGQVRVADFAPVVVQWADDEDDAETEEEKRSGGEEEPGAPA